MDHSRARQIEHSLLASNGGDVTLIAADVAQSFSVIRDALEPVIGPLGVRALYDRSLHLASASHSWLADSRGPDPARLDPAALKLTLARQTTADAASGGALLLQTFHDLLTSLIGSSLSGRLLRTVWVRFLSQDTPP